VPLKSPDGYALGTLCVLDQKPRQLRPEQKRALLVLARHVEAQLELRRHARQLAEAREHDDQQRSELAKAQAEILKLRGQLARQTRQKPTRRKSAC